MSAALAAVDRWVFQPGPAGRVRTLRALLAVLIGLRVALGPYRGLSGQPTALFDPVWFLAWLDRMPSVGVVVAVQVVGAVAAVLAAVGWRERGTFLVAWTSLLVLGGMRASRGKVMHNDVLLLLVAFVIVLAPVGLRALDRRRSPAWGWPAQTAIFVVGFAYFLTGFQKLVASGPAWVTSDNLRNVMYRAAQDRKAPTDAVALFVADRPWLAHLVALVTIVVELGGLVVLVVPRARPWYLLAVTALHVGVYLTHGLDYWAWIATAAIVLVDWSAVLATLTPLTTRTALTPLTPRSRDAGMTDASPPRRENAGG